MLFCIALIFIVLHHFAFHCFALHWIVYFNSAAGIGNWAVDEEVEWEAFAFAFVVVVVVAAEEQDSWRHLDS